MINPYEHLWLSHLAHVGLNLCSDVVGIIDALTMSIAMHRLHDIVARDITNLATFRCKVYLSYDLFAYDIVLCTLDTTMSAFKTREEFYRSAYRSEGHFFNFRWLNKWTQVQYIVSENAIESL